MSVPRAVVLALALMLLAGCSSAGPPLPSGLVGRSYVLRLPTGPGVTKVLAKLVATEGAPGDPNQLHLCHWPDQCRSPYSFVWLREELGTFPDEGALGGGPAVRWILEAVNARTGDIFATGGILGPEPTGSATFDRAQDLSPE